MSKAVRFAARDSAILVLTLLLWWLDRSAAAGFGTLARTLIAIAAGLGAALCGFLLHEWGHLLGARLAHAKLEFPAQLYSPFLFKFDVVHNGRREFLAMSYGGYASSVLGVVGLALVLPRDALSGQVGLLAGVLGVLATLALELPTTVRVYRGAPLPAEGVVYVSSPPPHP
jgi:hypothetical protein